MVRDAVVQVSSYVVMLLCMHMWQKFASRRLEKWISRASNHALQGESRSRVPYVLNVKTLERASSPTKSLTYAYESYIKTPGVQEQKNGAATSNRRSGNSPKRAAECSVTSFPLDRQGNVDHNYLLRHPEQAKYR